VLLLLVAVHLLWASLCFSQASMQSPAFISAVPGSFTVGAIFLHCVHSSIFLCSWDCEAVGTSAGTTVSSIVTYFSTFVDTGSWNIVWLAHVRRQFFLWESVGCSFDSGFLFFSRRWLRLSLLVECDIVANGPTTYRRVVLLDNCATLIT